MSHPRHANIYISSHLRLCVCRQAERVIEKGIEGDVHLQTEFQLAAAQLVGKLQTQGLKVITVQGVTPTADTTGLGLQLPSEQLLNGAVAAAPGIQPGLVCLLPSSALARQAFLVGLWAHHPVYLLLLAARQTQTVSWTEADVQQALCCPAWRRMH